MVKLNMKIYIILVSLIVVSETYVVRGGPDRSHLQKQHPGFGTNFLIFPGENGELIYGYHQINNYMLVLLEDLDPPDLKDITFTLYNRNTPEGWKMTDVQLLETYFDKTKKTKFVTHGWLSDGKSDVCIRIKNGFLGSSDVNVFVMDWHSISGNVMYLLPMAATPHVGQYLAKLLNYLIEELGVNPKDIHLIGHSLGAQIVGFAGRSVRKAKLGRITGLDPAKPGFAEGLVNGGHLNKNDAEFVDIIHTCAGLLGMLDPIGHVDFYPNGGGLPQPGCTDLLYLEICSHGRSWSLFAHSLDPLNVYVANRCLSLEQLDTENCLGNQERLGELTSPNARGVYYLATNGSEPFQLQAKVYA